MQQSEHLQLKNYKVKEIYYTLQGEGHYTGRAAVFCRFAGCNLWSGLEKDRDNAICKFCDTDFWGTDGVNGGKYSAIELATKVRGLFPTDVNPLVVCTGGEPALQLDKTLIDAFHQTGLEIAIETNGTVELAEGIDWICVSPKANTTILVTKGNELKLVFPQVENHPSQFQHLDFQHFYLQPLDNADRTGNTKACIDFCMENPLWKLSVQTHKDIGIA